MALLSPRLPPRPAAVPEWLRGPCLAAALGCADWGRREAPPASALAALGPEPWRIAERWRGRLAEARRRWGDSLAKSKDQLEVDLAREFEAAVLALRAAELPIPQKRGALAKGVRRRESLVQLFLDVLPPLLRRVAGASRGLHRGHVP